MWVLGWSALALALDLGSRFYHVIGDAFERVTGLLLQSIVIFLPGVSELLLSWQAPDCIAPLVGAGDGWRVAASSLPRGVGSPPVSGVSSGTKPDSTCDAECKERAWQRVGQNGSERDGWEVGVGWGSGGRA